MLGCNDSVIDIINLNKIVHFNFIRTRETLSSGHFMSVINVLMQLRKVCNHPDLFESRPIQSPFKMEGIRYYTASLITKALEHDPHKVKMLDDSLVTSSERTLEL